MWEGERLGGEVSHEHYACGASARDVIKSCTMAPCRRPPAILLAVSASMLLASCAAAPAAAFVAPVSSRHAGCGILARVADDCRSTSTTTRWSARRTAAAAAAADDRDDDGNVSFALRRPSLPNRRSAFGSMIRASATLAVASFSAPFFVGVSTLLGVSMLSLWLFAEVAFFWPVVWRRRKRPQKNQKSLASSD